MHHDAIEEYRPRLIVWQLTSFNGHSQAKGVATTPLVQGAEHNGSQQLQLSQHECLLVVDSLARLSKPIVVLTGPYVTDRKDLHDIVSYGIALGLKMIIEAKPEELTDNVVKLFRPFGPRIFRLAIDNRIVEDMHTRYRRSQEFNRLEKTIKRLRSGGFEIHLSLTIRRPNLRNLAFYVDYAFRCAAHGLYCHLDFDDAFVTQAIRDGILDEFVASISELKSCLPSNMYFSPQCIKYCHQFQDDGGDIDARIDPNPRWGHSCLAGKSFAFIDDVGKVYMCLGSRIECGDLRSCKYDFKQIWQESALFNYLREHRWSCQQTRNDLFNHATGDNGSEIVDEHTTE